MSNKRPLGFSSLGSKLKRRKSGEDMMSFFQKTLLDCGLKVKDPPEKCVALEDPVFIIRNLTKKLMEDDSDSHVVQFFTDFERACNTNKMFEYYLFPNIVGIDNASNTYTLSDSVIKILLNVTFLQENLINLIFDKVMDLMDQPDFGLWVKTVLKSLSALNTIKNSEILATKLMDLLDLCSDCDKSVRLEIISAIPDIIGDQEHDNVASEMRRIMSTNRDLLPSILDCLTYLCLSDEQYKLLREETLKNMNPINAAYFPNFIKFLLMRDRSSDDEYVETIKGIRKELGWTSLIGSQEELATSQVLTATAIRNSMLSSKAVAKAWLNVLSSCNISTDHKPIDIIFFLILYSLSEEKEKQVETVMRKLIKMQILKEDLLDEAFKKFKPILKDNLVNSMSLISLANSLVKCTTEPLVQTFASHMYSVMFTELTDCGQIIVAELLKLVLYYKKSALNTLNILNNIASENLSLLKRQSLQILTLLDRMDEMTLTEIRAVRNLVCRLAFSIENSDIRDQVEMIIKKELGSCIPSIKIQGIIAGIHAVKYLTKRNGENTADLPEEDDDDEITLSMTTGLSEDDLKKAAEIIRLINHSTQHNPDMIAFFYDELYIIIEQGTDMSKKFVGWLTKVLTNNWQANFLVDQLENNKFGEIEISSQFCLNQDFEVDEKLAVNIAGLALKDDKNVHIEILSPLFQLVRALHYKQNNGDLSTIDALLGFAIIMPKVDIDSIVDLSEASVSNILDCYIHCVNWIRELLNAFVSQKDDDNVLKPKILKRILQLKELDNAIEEIFMKKHMTYKPPIYFSQAVNISNIREQVERRTLFSHVTKQKKGKKSEHDNTVVSESSKSQQTKTGPSVKNKFAALHNIRFRPLNLNLIELLRYDLTPDDVADNKLTFRVFNYILKHVNGGLDKILISRIKKPTFLNKDSVEIYSRSEAERQVTIIKEILPNVMIHMDLITSFIKCNIVDDTIDFESMYISKIMESCLCLEHIYNLLTIYFRWVEFKNSNVSTLNNSLKIVGKVGEDESFSMANLLNSFQGHDNYCITLSCAVSLIELMKVLSEHSTESNVPPIVKNMAHHFLSKQWEDHEKGLIYNQAIDILIKAYLGNNTIRELKDIITPLVNDLEKLRDKTSVLPNLKSVNKSNFILFFRNLGTALYDQIKTHLNSGMSDEERVEMWATVATILNLMSKIVAALDTKNMISTFFKKLIPVLSTFLSKVFPILKVAFKQHREPILDMLKEFQATTKLYSMFLNSKGKFDRALTKRIPDIETMLMKFDHKTRDLLTSHDCLEDLKLFTSNGRRNTRKTKKNTATGHSNDVTVEDCDDDFPEDLSEASSDFNENDHAGISDVF
ncbi:Fanconi anemia group D2 protein [Epargyreus clarus]|uniref:Fanconi anemia group D2 protein n=1 Tax=Epargyreus clarus TaxID=520877 RepID=UPI003C2ED0C2